MMGFSFNPMEFKVKLTNGELRSIAIEGKFPQVNSLRVYTINELKNILGWYPGLKFALKNKFGVIIGEFKPLARLQEATLQNNSQPNPKPSVKPDLVKPKIKKAA